jgi:hypothetical protein
LHLQTLLPSFRRIAMTFIAGTAIGSGTCQTSKDPSSGWPKALSKLGQSRTSLQLTGHQRYLWISINGDGNHKFLAHAPRLDWGIPISAITPPYQLRMLELLPGGADEPIQTKLSHHPLFDLPLCEALSYEWGPPTRDHEIICCGKILKVTTNLLAVLKRLRSESSTPRLLWIDAICINQEDIIEQSKQVKLMTYVYRYSGRTLVWIGEAPPLLAREAWLFRRSHKLWNGWTLMETGM